ncbi:MAG: FAD-dependent oxidoreductase [Oscillospiraceae bacterium]|jgi:glycerol-3-phosphate dehydrogenase|nr:FAD-dependent oxidoreductase [Oscillospiraceae bacterium]
MNTKKIQKKLDNAFAGGVHVAVEDGCIVLRGTLNDWGDVVRACSMAVQKKGGVHVVNDICLAGAEKPKMRLPAIEDNSLDGRAPDVLIVGGGISGATIARELSKWELDILLVEKEADVALQASGRNDGEVHPGIDLGRGTLKHSYIRKANAMFERVCGELEVPFDRCGQYVLFSQPWLRPLVRLYVRWRRYHSGIEDSVLLSGKEVLRREPNANPNTRFAIYNPSAGSVCPYGLTIAYAENAVQNGAKISLNTAVLGMEVQTGRITSVLTNRGTVFPRLVVNAAGVFAEDVAAMAGDRFFSIHPRRGTNTILDKKKGEAFRAIAGIKELTTEKTHTKGGGIVHTVHGNLLVGPDAVETYEKENFATARETIEKVFLKQKKVLPELSERDIITYFTGVRAPTFEEDYIIEIGRKTKNLIHCAGIQSPGLTTAPAVALDVEKMAVEALSEGGEVKKNSAFNPRRKAVPELRHMSREERAALIAQNPDYGVIVCRCEEISRGEILDALNSPLCVPTLDGVKKRLRPGMGRCQGGFCAPLVAKIIAEHQGVTLSAVTKSGADAVICYGETKGACVHAAI